RDLHLVGARGSRLPGAGRRPAVPADPHARSARAGGSKTRAADLVRSDLVYGHESFLPPTASASEPANFSASAFARGSRYEITSSRRSGAGDASTSPLWYRRADGLRPRLSRISRPVSARIAPIRAPSRSVPSIIDRRSAAG